MATLQAILYTRHGCHLCDDAHSLLIKAGITPQIIDIESDPELLKKFTICVPVVEINGKVRFRGRVNPILLRRLLQNQELT